MPRNQKKIDPALLVVISIILLLSATIAIILVNVQSDALSVRLEEDSFLPLLIFIADGKELIATELVFIDTNTKNLAIYDVPRNLGTIIPSLGRVDRIDNLYRDLGAQKTKAILETIFDTQIEFFMDLSIDNVAVLVDLVEGVTVFLSRAIEDEMNEERISIPGGNVRLDGEKTSHFILYEGENERSLEWVSRRWTFVREFLRSTGEYTLLRENDDLASRFFKHLGINFDKPAAKTFFNILSDLAFDDMLTQQILGNERQVESADGAETILFPHFEGQVLRDSIKQISQSLGALETAYTIALSSHLEILNGTGTNGLAGRTQDLYQNFGFEVDRIGNADDDAYTETIIVDRSNNLERAKKVGNIIRADNIVVGPPLTDYPEIDITIILGADFDGWSVGAKK